ncbi:hypothetical protein V6N11_082646 [Hibiscus sabdariffa]|uniref:RNase H type-1 domain-containing protein n=1 Tax=Hibiscus sabdariffa TaxID=183260 RepID=A0ABR2P9A7_9ROSI
MNLFLMVSVFHCLTSVWASHFAATILDVAMANHASVDHIQWVAPPHDWVCLNTDVVVQSDNSVAICMILDLMAASSSSSLVHRISSLQNHPWSLRFLWVPREANMVADGLSKLPSLHGFQLRTFDDIPESIRPLLTRDRDGPPYRCMH